MDSKERVLRHLKLSGQSRLAEVATALGQSKQGALRHLDGLEAAGLVQHWPAGGGGAGRPGRPEHVYRLTEAAADAFPSAYRELAAELAAAMSPEQLADFFERRAAARETLYRARLAGLNFEERALELSRLASEDGHMADLERLSEGLLKLRHCNCPIQEVAARTGHACQHELSMYERLLEAEVVRTSWVGAADATCSYEIRDMERTGK